MKKWEDKGNIVFDGELQTIYYRIYEKEYKFTVQRFFEGFGKWHVSVDLEGATIKELIKYLINR